MRVRTFHRHSVNRTSTVLAALIPLHFLYSFCFSLPIWFTFFGIRWNRGELTSGQRAWLLCVLLVFAAVEAIRGFLGYFANLKMLIADLCGYMGLCVVPQLILICVLLVNLPGRNDLEFSVCLTQLLLVIVETLASARMVWRLARNNTVDFYVELASTMTYG